MLLLSYPGVKTDVKLSQPGWMYYERSRLHKALLNAAVSPNGPGQPVEILLGSRVEAATETAQITLTDGRTVQGDVVVGADGFHVSCLYYAPIQ